MTRLAKIALTAVLVLVQVPVLLGGYVTEAAEKGEASLRWRTKVIPVAISNSLLRPSSNIKNGSDLLGAVRRSLKAWEEASGIEFRIVYSEKLNVSPQGAAGDGVSLITVAPTAENSLLFAKNAEDVAATTRVFFDARGRITEADIVLNPYQQFSSDGTFGSFDLEATLTHEIGHVLGLDHSSVRASTMYENFSKNGVFGLQGFSQRTLSELDRAAVRAKYGAPNEQENCCGSILATLQLPEGRPAANVEVWLEDSATGKVISQTVTSVEGAAEFSGIPHGTYELFSARKERAKRPLPMQSLGTVSVSAAEPSTVQKKLEAGPDDIELTYTGFNGQLALGPVPINSGKSYTIYIGGRNLSAKGTSISFSSPFLAVNPDSIAAHDYGDGLSVLSFEVTADPQIPLGEYTVFVETAAGSRSAVVGGVSVRSFVNPFSNFILDSKIY